MRFTLQQKLLAFGDDFSAFDEAGKLAYFFDGKVFAFGKKIVIQSGSGKELGVIRRKLFAFRPTFIVRKDRGVVATIYKKLFSFRKGFFIDVPGPDDITVTGEVFEHNYSFVKNGREIAKVVKQWFKGQDTYSVDLSSGDDPLLVLSAVVIIDILCHPKRDSGFKDSN